MDHIFADLIKQGMTIVYMDDLMTFAANLDDLKQFTKIVLQRLRDHNLFIKAKKCEFHKPKIEYLGMVIEDLYGFSQTKRHQELARTDDG